MFNCYRTFAGIRPKFFLQCKVEIFHLNVAASPHIVLSVQRSYDNRSKLKKKLSGAIYGINIKYILHSD